MPQILSILNIIKCIKFHYIPYSIIYWNSNELILMSYYWMPHVHLFIIMIIIIYLRIIASAFSIDASHSCYCRFGRFRNYTVCQCSCSFISIRPHLNWKELEIHLIFVFFSCFHFFLFVIAANAFWFLLFILEKKSEKKNV